MNNRAANLLIIVGLLLILMRVGRMLMIYSEGRNVFETVSIHYYLAIGLGVLTLALGIYTRRKNTRRKV